VFCIDATLLSTRRCFLRNLNNDSLSRFVLKKIRHLIVYEMFERRDAASECRSINRECVSDKVEQTLTSSIPRLQRVILALPLRSHRSTIRTDSLRSTLRLPNLAFSISSTNYKACRKGDPEAKSPGERQPLILHQLYSRRLPSPFASREDGWRFGLRPIEAHNEVDGAVRGGEPVGFLVSTR
jgi:hypothetical protein